MSIVLCRSRLLFYQRSFEVKFNQRLISYSITHRNASAENEKKETEPNEPDQTENAFYNNPESRSDSY